MSEASAATMFHDTIEDEIGTMSPRGKVKMTPTPSVAAKFQRRKNTSGTVGDVAHDKAVRLTHTGEPGSSR